MDIRVKRFTFDAKHKWFLFLLFDLNDLLGRPFRLVVEESALYQGWSLRFNDWEQYPEGSTKREFVKTLYHELKAYARRSSEGKEGVDA